MQRTTIDGVTTFWEDLPGQFRAALVFGVGERDATFRTVGAAHLVEHLAMNGLPKSHIFRNAMVDLEVTTFLASGEPGEVVDFLAHVCRALGDLPYHQLEREARVLGVEGGSVALPALGWALARRFGLRGPGLAFTGGAGVDNLTAADLEAFVASYCVRSNAVLVLTQEPPAEIVLPLREGTRPPRLHPPRLPLATPALAHGETPYPVLSFEIPDAPAAAATVMKILDERVVDEARHSRGLIYDTATDAHRLDGSCIVVALQADAPEKDADEILGVLWTILNDLATDGPTQEELDLVRRGHAAYFDDIGARFDVLLDRAVAHLAGRLVPDEEVRAAYADLDHETVRSWFAAGVRTALVGTPRPVRESLAGLADASATETGPEPFVGESFPKRLVAFAPRGAGVTLNDDGLANKWVGGRWDDVVGLGARPPTTERSSLPTAACFPYDAAT